jgi:GNAT superfamily N-acetyltransferase
LSLPLSRPKSGHYALILASFRGCGRRCEISEADFKYETAKDLTAILCEELLLLCGDVFSEFDPSYLTDRLPRISDPVLHIARTNGQLVAFKLAYRRGHKLLYSWLGGVHPEARGKGLAQQLMRQQHQWAIQQGYSFVETRTRATNVTMIILNLKSGFVVSGYETDPHGLAIVTQRKSIDPSI